jgi:hypothetical protein
MALSSMAVIASGPPDIGGEQIFTDEELTWLALAADPDAPLDEDAPSVSELFGVTAGALLPAWYMPSPMSGRRHLTGWRRWVVIAVVVTFVLIEAAGLCSTYGSIVVG